MLSSASERSSGVYIREYSNDKEDQAVEAFKSISSQRSNANIRISSQRSSWLPTYGAHP